MPFDGGSAAGNAKDAALSFPNDNRAARVIRQARRPALSVPAALERLARASGKILAPPPHPVLAGQAGP